jgi:hypothetical protein
MSDQRKRKPDDGFKDGKLITHPCKKQIISPVHMFVVGDLVRIAHNKAGEEFLKLEECPCYKTCASKEHLNQDVGVFGHILKINTKNDRDELVVIESGFLDSYSNEYLIEVSCNIPTNDRPQILLQNACDLINYRLLGNDLGDIVFEKTRDRDIGIANQFPKSNLELLNDEFIFNLEPNEDEKTIVERHVEEYNNAAHAAYHQLMMFQLQFNHDIRRDFHNLSFQEKNNEDEEEDD